MTNVLYRKYRPSTFAQVAGQDHVVRAIQGALTSDRVGHAYLFTGPRGVGKTTMARLLAKALNCSERQKTKKTEPCNTCFSCQEMNEGRSLDIIEIDGASNRGIDEIRNLKEAAQVAASSGGRKIFIIDEVHMLTPPAFSALLKTLEEPPAHVVFILATTDAHKIPATILSRVQRFDYKKITAADIATKLQAIAEAEKIELASEAALAIAQTSEGALRDAESALTKLIAFTSPVAGSSKKNQITIDHVRDVLGIMSPETHHELLAHLSGQHRSPALALVSRLYESGASLEIFMKQFVSYLRSALLFKIDPALAISTDWSIDRHADTIAALSPERLTTMIQVLSEAKKDLRNAAVPQLPLELAICKLTMPVSS